MKDNLKLIQIEIANKILIFLEELIKNNYYERQKVTWGYAFNYLSALNLSYNKNSILVKSSISKLLQQDTNDKNYPWEFVVFALRESFKISKIKIHHPANNLRKKGTKVLNWQLLNLLNKLNFNKFGFFDEIYLKFLIKFFQREDGLFMDQIKTRSLQYHNFSLFILLKILEKKKNLIFLENSIHKGIKLSRSLIYKDGTANFIGRGQEQIFGYGSLIGALKIYSNILNENTEDDLSKLINKIKNFQADNGFIPLVLRSNNPEKYVHNYACDRPPGWYSYNTELDYLPFLAYCLSL